MNTACLDASRPRRSIPVKLRVVIVLALGLLMLAQSGCRMMWQRVRESERIYALNTARNQTGRGQCVKGLDSLDRAEARMDIGIYAREAVAARLRCYEKLELQELASAHRRLIQDFYTDEPMALPEADGTSVFRVANPPTGNFEPPPGWLKIPRPRYSPYAQRSKIVGRVVVSFELSKAGRPTQIRVLEMPHPLLATWAIESVSQAEKDKKFKQNVVVLPNTLHITTFLFEWRWANEDPDEDDY